MDCGYLKGRLWAAGIAIALAMLCACIPHAAFAADGEGSSASDPTYGVGIIAGDETESGSESTETDQEAADEESTPVESAVGVTYQVHVKGATSLKARASNGGLAGTKGGSKPIDTFCLWVETGSYAGSVKYRAYTNGKKWTSWASDGTSLGTSSKRIAMNGLQVRLTGDIAKAYDVVYRSYLETGGWQPWVVDGALSGFASGSHYVKAVEVKLVKKGSAGKVGNGTYVITKAGNRKAELASNGSGIKKASYSKSAQAGKFYVRNEKGGVTLQSIDTGKFVTAGSSVSLKKWSGAANQVWKLSWDGGLRLSNKATGKTLALNGSKATVGASGTGFSFTSTHMLANGTFHLGNAASSTMLAVKGASFDTGANVVVASRGEAGNHVFTIKRRSGSWYSITNVMTHKAIEVAGGSSKSGANVRQGKKAVSKARLWKPGISRNGTFYFTNKASGKALTATRSAVSGANVTSSTYTASSAQRWKLVPDSWRGCGNAELDRYVIGVASANGYDLRRCFNWMGSLRHVQSVDSRLHHGVMSQAVVNSYVAIAKSRGVADCYTDAAMFCMLARMCGYNANAYAGGCPSASRGTVPHGWTEVYQGGRTYVCDANLRRDLPSYNWYMVTYATSPVVYTR